MPQWGALLTAMVTPFDSDLNVDYDRAAELTKWLLAHRTEGLVVCGTTGEGPTVTRDEKLKLFEVVKQAAGDAPVIANTGSNDTTASIELTRAAQEVGVDGVMVTCPSYNKPSQEGIYQHFAAVAAATDLPIIIYNIPSRTGRNIEAATTLRLAEIDNIAAVKEASGDLKQMAQIRRNAPDDFLLYSGDDSMLLPVLAIGGHGVISVASHIAGELLADMIAAFRAGDVSKAAQIHLLLQPVFHALFLPTSVNPCCLKRAMEIIGFPTGGVRLPLVETTPEETETIRSALQESGLI